MGIFKKLTAVGGTLILVLALAFPINIFAYDDTILYGETSLYFADMDDEYNFTNKLDEVIEDNYWSNLQAVDVETIEANDDFKSSYFKIALPEHLLKPDETEINNYARHIDFGGFGGYEFYNFGIIPNWAGFAQGDRFMFRDNPGENPYLKQTFEIMEGSYNPFNFTPGVDTLTEEEAVDPLNKLKVLADIKKKGSSDSQKVDEYSKGDSLDLDLSISVPWFKRLYNSHAMAKMQIGGISEEGANKLHDQFVMSDSQILAVLDIPKEVTVKNPSASISGIEGFSATVTQKDNQLIISFRKDERAKVYTWQDMVDKIGKIDTSNIHLSISGLTVSENAELEKEATIKVQASGIYDWATSRTEKFYISSPEHNSHEEFGPGHENSSERLYWSFAAVQDPEGLDIAAPKDKPNLISYTFKVTKPADNTVTFINEDHEYAKTKVENGKTIDSDALADESMPDNPTKAGYTFKEWNTSKDGTGTSFNGSTTVTDDIIVYAIYNLNAATMNEAPKLVVTDKTIKVGEDLDLRDLIVSATDKEDGDLKDKVVIADDGGFNKDKVGEYAITFKVRDTGGASVTKTATVKVVEKKASPQDHEKNQPTNQGDKVDNPTNTGDNSGMTTYILMMLVSATCLVILRRIVLKRNEN